jgi:hypothetical protein
VVFDIAEYGEGLADVGTHVVDLVQWTALPDQPIDYRHDIQVLDGRRWPLVLTPSQFEQVTGGASSGGEFRYFCNNSVDYTLRGVRVTIDIRWNWEAPPGTGDIYEAAFRGSKASVEIRQGQAEKSIPELYIVPANASRRPEIFPAVRVKVAALQSDWPGLRVEETPHEARLAIPERFRVGHEAHFAQVARRFFQYLQAPTSLPSWERSYMLAKYYVSTKGVELGREKDL